MKTTPTKRKHQSGVQAARGRLRGALNDTIPSTDFDSDDNENDEDDIDDDEEEEEVESKRLIARPRGRPPKRVQTPPSSNRYSSSTSPMTPSRKRKRDHKMSSNSNTPTQKIQAESFIMKLFDRSLDLSKYTERTPLYPICRAWMANQPRNPNVHSSSDKLCQIPTEPTYSCGETLVKLKSGEMKQLHQMPRCKKADLPRLPKQATPTKYTAEDDLIKADDPLCNATRENLMKHNLSKWKTIKQDWKRHTNRYNQRSELNFMIIKELFGPNA